ncbi:MAG TPA: hypothetical protein DDX89_08390 [Candidatus Omnitrophica bacterium]|nr:MAG: hypothetical protein A2Z92_01715 [Omnitrophica WOR_2 bacterium GWA2_63_20]OGX18298.1 MAG: hypothetical protein A2105_01580 [Omnitrophica WOR_2 bacterium GWF2_63_9]OGX31413.1 MAG: hypothetical protein A3E56_02540 [Omnitrophica WOR_2 bacterium RIFCSPHIGHO2_12_FULL_64_13]OGX36976.1 MAG: hypothetical protein A3B73_01575 [Omnitrophica WOR_2 bacterium RIFCSPHIGHO2_02_FULL_63_39]OGX46417.1 MAG: hypothetical protein A3I71_02970 [Omnitrophica WOR_2 bacterium RIFCSPLOWO2_02_FULL_63_16]OGX49830.1
MRRLVIELTRSSLRAVSVHNSPTKPQVQRVLVEPIHAAPDGAWLRGVLKPLEPAGMEVISVISREHVITRILTLPSTHREELDQMVRLAAKAQLPFPPEQAAMDWALLEEHDGTSVVQLVACQREVIDRHLTLLREGGVEPAVLIPSSWGVAGWYRYFGRSDEQREPAFIVHVDCERTNLVLVRGDGVMSSRSLNQGLAEWQASLAPLLQELERSLASVRKELPGLDAASVMLTGVGPLEEWRGTIESRVSLPVVVRQGEGPMKRPEILSAQTHATLPTSLAVVMGLAFADCRTAVNLLPPDVREAHRQRRRLRELMVTAALFATALLCGTGVLMNLVHRTTHQTRHLTEVMHQLEALTGRTAQQLDDVRVIERLLTGRRQLAEALAALIQATPPEVLFETVTFERARRELVVRGSAPTTRDVLDYLRVLKDDPHWRQVELRYSARRGSSAEALTAFEIAVALDERSS